MEEMWEERFLREKGDREEGRGKVWMAGGRCWNNREEWPQKFEDRDRVREKWPLEARSRPGIHSEALVFFR